MIKTENQWKAALVKELRSRGVMVLSLHGHAMQAPGWPDIFVADKLWSGWIELKAHDGELSGAQRIIGRKLEALRQFVLLRAHEDWSSFDVLNVAGYRPDWMPLETVGITDVVRLLEIMVRF